jgi:hypothetical protein
VLAQHGCGNASELIVALVEHCWTHLAQITRAPSEDFSQFRVAKQLFRNAFIESFCVHARSLLDFFSRAAAPTHCALVDHCHTLRIWSDRPY